MQKHFKLDKVYPVRDTLAFYRLPIVSNGVNRILDANINRSKEGLRVCEEITRFALSDKPLTFELKKIRHNIDAVIKKSLFSLSLIQERNSAGDVGRGACKIELKRSCLGDIFFANIQRVKESIRVLEEFSKLKDTNAAVEFKKLRYRTYEIEKKAAEKILSLRCNR